MDTSDETDDAAEYYRKRSEWLDYVNLRDDLTHADFRVAFFMARKMGHEKKCMWWSVAEIAKAMGVSTATVTAATIRMQNLGLMVVHRPARGNNRYWFRMPYDPEGEKHKKRKPRTQKLRKSHT